MPDEIVEFPAQNAHAEQPEIPVGTPVIGFDVQRIGEVHEVLPHYLLVGSAGEHTDFEVPAQSILKIRDGAIHVHVARQIASVVDEQETARHLIDGEHPSH
jgi:hypothetical protein